MTRPSRVRLVALDMVGTTVTDDGVVREAFIEAGKAMGIDQDPDRYAAAAATVHSMMGRSKIEVFQQIFGDAATAAQANGHFERAYAQAVAAGRVAALPGVEALLRALRARDIRCCLTTGFAPTTRDLIVDTLGWKPFIDLAISPADAGRGRPYPDMILTAVLRLRIDDLMEVAVAGDTTNDLLAGSRARAGIVAGVLTGAHDRAELQAAPHTHLLDTVGQLIDLV